MRKLSMVALGIGFTLALVACGGGSAKPVPTTTTQPPPTTTTAPPPVLTIVPATASIGTVVTLTVSGAKPGESYTFSLTGPKGKVFNGSPHAVEATGIASATYNTTGDVVGAQAVQAIGSGGITLTGTFTLTKS